MASQKYFPKSGLPHLWGKIKGYVDGRVEEVNPVGMFSLEVDTAGNLYCVYPDGTTPPDFDYDTATGNLYLIVPD